MQFGLVTDIHQDAGLHPDGDNKLGIAVTEWNLKEVDFAIEVGDFITSDPADLPVIEAAYTSVSSPRYYVMGNHELINLSKAQFIAGTGMTEAYYSFDVASYHFVVLDACYYDDDDGAEYDSGNFDWRDTYINPGQRTWLTNDLVSTDLKTFVFCHQRLDGVGDAYVNNAAAVRSILEDSGKVLAVFMGHGHTNALVTINGIDYYEMEDLVADTYPASTFAIVKVFDDDSLQIRGYGLQDSY